MEWWDKMTFPMRTVCSRFAKRLRIRKTGLLKLRNDVRTCEYEDVHVLWEMLKRTETELTSPKRSTGNSKKRACWKLIEWAKRAPCLCRSF